MRRSECRVAKSKTPLKYEPHQNSRVITGVLERLVHSVYFIINVKENQRGDQEWTIYEVKIPKPN